MNDSNQDKQALLKELTIDRRAEPEHGWSSKKWWIAVIVCLSAAIFLLTRSTLFSISLPRSTVVPIKTAFVTSAPEQASSILDATGYVVARRQATVSSKQTGKVVQVFVEEGMLVKEDQLLATLDDRIEQAQLALARSRMASAKAAMLETEIALKQAQLDLRRVRELASKQLASQADLDRAELDVMGLEARLERSEKELGVAEGGVALQRQIVADMEIRAPFSGIVTAKAAQPGEMISPVSAGGGFTRTGICTIVDMDSLEVEVDVNEAFINRVRADQEATVTLNAYGQDRFKARVIAVIPAADRSKATVRVRVALLEKDERILPDMGLQVAFLAEVSEESSLLDANTVFIPGSAILTEGSEDIAYLVKENKVERRVINLGSPSGNRVAIVKGLSTGDRIVLNLTPDLAMQLQRNEQISIIQ